MRAPWREQGRNRRRRGQGQRDLDEYQRLVDKPGVKERVASTVGRIDAPPELVPVADFVHRFVADDLLEHRRRRGPVDAAQNQEAAIKPRTEQVHKIAIDDGERRVLVDEREHVRPHFDERCGAAWRAIEPPEQLVAAGLRGEMDFACRGFVAVRTKVRYGVAHPLAIGPELVGERLEERRLLRHVERAVPAQDLGGERDP